MGNEALLNSLVKEQEGVLTMGDFLARSAPKETPGVVASEKSVLTYDEFMGKTATPKMGPIKPISPEHKNTFLIDTALRFAGAMSNGYASFNQTLGFLTGLNTFKKYRETFIIPYQKQMEQIREVTKPDNLGSRVAYDLAESFGNLAVTLPADIMLGEAMKFLSAGKVLPKVEALLSRLPDFALGSGLTGLANGVQEGNNVFERTYKGLIGAGESVAINTAFGNVTNKIAGMPIMSALNAAQATYEASKEGRPPSKDELISAAVSGAAMWLAFSTVPILKKATKIGPEKLALGKYETQIEAHLNEGNLEGVQKTFDQMFVDPRIRPEIKESLKMVLEPEKVSAVSKELLPKEVTELTTGDLEKLIDKRYEAGATQKELDLLEIEYAKRVTEEDLQISEGDVHGSDFTEALVDNYQRYLEAQTEGVSHGSSAEEIKSNFRSVAEEMALKPLKLTVTNEQVFEAAKELYERKQQLLERQRSKNKEFPLKPIEPKPVTPREPVAPEQPLFEDTMKLNAFKEQAKNFRDKGQIKEADMMDKFIAEKEAKLVEPKPINEKDLEDLKSIQDLMSYTEPNLLVDTGEGKKIIPGGAPAHFLKGENQRDIATLVKKLEAGKPLTKIQNDKLQDLLKGFRKEVLGEVPESPKPPVEAAKETRVESLTKGPEAFKTAEKYVESKKANTGFALEQKPLYHETSPQGLESVLFGERGGLNVSTDKNLALGQGGKGVVVEFDPIEAEGVNIKKPSSAFVGFPEKEILKGLSDRDIKTITFKKEIPVPKIIGQRLKNLGWKITKLEDGSLQFENPLTRKSQLISEWEAVQKLPVAEPIKPIEPKPVALVEPKPIVPIEPVAEGDPYQKNFELQQDKLKTATPIKDAFSRTVKRIADEVNKAFVPISTRLDIVSGSLKHSLRKFEFRTRMQTYEDINQANALLSKYTKLDIKDATDLDFALKNRDSASVEKIINKNGMQKEFKEVSDLLERVYQRAQDVGLDFAHLEKYFPRRVKDAEGLLSYLRGTKEWSVLDEAIRRQEKAQGFDFETSDKANFVDEFLFRAKSEKTGTPKPSFTKERLWKQITPEMNQFYKDSSQALIDYVEAMNHAIETRRFFGKESKTVEKTIGSYVQQLVNDGMISSAQMKEVRDIIHARFTEKGTSGLWTTYKNLSYIATMNTPINAITQLGDIAFSVYKNGLFETGSAIFGRERIRKEDIGIHNIAQEFTSDTATSGKLVNKLFQTIGLDKLDRIGKEALINAGLERLSKEANKKGDTMLPKLETIFGEEAAPQVLSDLKVKKLSEDVKYLLFSEVSDFQPVSHTEMPERYLKGGNSRILYMLKSYTLKALDVYHNDVLREMKTDPVKGMQNFVRLTTALVAAGVTTDWIKDFILGKTGELSDYVINNIIKTAGFNKYTMINARKDGAVSAFVSSIMPPVPYVDALAKDIFSEKDIADWKIWSKLPYVGTFYYWWLGGGSNRPESTGAGPLTGGFE